LNYKHNLEYARVSVKHMATMKHISLECIDLQLTNKPRLRVCKCALQKVGEAYEILGIILPYSA